MPTGSIGTASVRAAQCGSIDGWVRVQVGATLRVLTLFEVPLVELFEVGSQFRFRSGVERVGTGTGKSGVAGCGG